MMPATIATALVFGVAGAAVLIALEIRRRDRRNIIERIVASIAAAAALSLLAIYRSPADAQPREAITEAVLWTLNARADQVGKTLDHPHFALPGATQKSAGAITVPDVAYIRRALPALRRLLIVGDGLEPFVLDILGGINLVFERTAPASTAPVISFLHVPREIALGEPLRVRGRLDSLRSGETITFALAGPDDEKTEANVAASDTAGGTTFELDARTPQSAGWFAWRLSAREPNGRAVVDATLGIGVVRPVLPRVLIVESSPRVDTAHLRRWFADVGGALVSRRQVARDRYRFATSDDSRAEFDGITRDLLARFDVVLADVAALNALSPEERGAVDGAIREEGIGLLAVDPAGSTTAADAESLIPWRLDPAGDISEGEDGTRTARLTWRSLSVPLEQPIGIENLRIVLSPRQQTLVADTQQRPIVAALQRGRGRVAISLARNTWAWRLQGQSAAFASYWSHLFTELAKPLERQAHRWSIDNATSEQLLVNRPVHLRLSGPRDAPSGAHAKAEFENHEVQLPLAEDRAEPHQWRTTFWPRRAGWHKVQLGSDGAQIDFFVQEANAWSSLGTARRTRATQIAAAQSQGRASAGFQQPEHVSAGVNVGVVIALYTLFLASGSYLWLERRRASG